MFRCAWRKYFALKESSSNHQDDDGIPDEGCTTPQEQQETRNNTTKEEVALQGDKDWQSSASNSSPVQSAEAVRARNDFVQGLYRGMYSARHPQQQPRQPQQQHPSWNMGGISAVERTVVSRNNLDIPIREIASCTIEQ